jgi:FKBP-type peptidyl-prolyl cis-trans isomerase (trigger factor)
VSEHDEAEPVKLDDIEVKVNPVESEEEKEIVDDFADLSLTEINDLKNQIEKLAYNEFSS